MDFSASPSSTIAHPLPSFPFRQSNLLFALVDLQCYICKRVRYDRPPINKQGICLPLTTYWIYAYFSQSLPQSPCFAQVSLSSYRQDLDELSSITGLMALMNSYASNQKVLLDPTLPQNLKTPRRIQNHNYLRKLGLIEHIMQHSFQARLHFELENNPVLSTHPEQIWDDIGAEIYAELVVPVTNTTQFLSLFDFSNRHCPFLQENAVYIVSSHIHVTACAVHNKALYVFDANVGCFPLSEIREALKATMSAFCWDRKTIVISAVRPKGLLLTEHEAIEEYWDQYAHRLLTEGSVCVVADILRGALRKSSPKVFKKYFAISLSPKLFRHFRRHPFFELSLESPNSLQGMRMLIQYNLVRSDLLYAWANSSVLYGYTGVLKVLSDHLISSKEEPLLQSLLASIQLQAPLVFGPDEKVFPSRSDLHRSLVGYQDVFQWFVENMRHLGLPIDWPPLLRSMHWISMPLNVLDRVLTHFFKHNPHDYHAFIYEALETPSWAGSVPALFQPRALYTHEADRYYRALFASLVINPCHHRFLIFFQHTAPTLGDFLSFTGSFSALFTALLHLPSLLNATFAQTHFDIVENLYLQDLVRESLRCYTLVSAPIHNLLLNLLKAMTEKTACAPFPVDPLDIQQETRDLLLQQQSLIFSQESSLSKSALSPFAYEQDSQTPAPIDDRHLDELLPPFGVRKSTLERK